MSALRAQNARLEERMGVLEATLDRVLSQQL